MEISKAKLNEIITGLNECEGNIFYDTREFGAQTDPQNPDGPGLTEQKIARLSSATSDAINILNALRDNQAIIDRLNAIQK